MRSTLRSLTFLGRRSTSCLAIAFVFLTVSFVYSAVPANESPAPRSVSTLFKYEPLAVALTMTLALAILVCGLLFEHRRRLRAELDARRYLATMAHMDRRAAMGELAASIAHELNQPLGAILRNAEAARMLLASDSPPVQELQEIVEDIRKDDKRAGELIRRMRTLLRRRELEAQPIDLNAVARDTIDLVSPEAAQKGVGLELAVSNGPIVVTGDRVHLQQVLLNLMLNGMDAMAAVPADRRRLTVRTATNNGHVEVSVRDTGSGIAADPPSQIFEPFFTTKGDGMGMGLSIARRIVEAHDGRIAAANNADGGATIRFSLPVKPRHKEEDGHDLRQSC